MRGWDNFFTAQVAASAALAGLLFVGTSLNLAKILSTAGLPNRALAGFCLLLAALVISSLLLIPAQPSAVIGAEILAVGLVLWGTVTPLNVISLQRSETRHRRHFVRHLFFVQGAVIPYVVGGIVLLTGAPGGLYWVAAAVILSLAAASVEAWILLIEINR